MADSCLVILNTSSIVVVLSHCKLHSYKYVCLNFFSIETESDLSIVPFIGTFMRPLIEDNFLHHISEPSIIDKKFNFNQLIPCNLCFSLCEMSEDNQDSQCMKLHTFIGVLNFYSKLYIPSTLNIDLTLWHTQLIVCAVKC